MFIGEYQHLIDDKGRLAVPAKFRTALKSGAVVTKGLDQCLFMFTKKEWTEIAKKISALPFSQANSRAFARHMLGGAMEVDLDVQGRILLPDYLRQYAGLHKQSIIAGLYNRLEIWNEERWKGYKQKTEASSDDISERLDGLGI
ncbi:MAG: division/cell wall cluster transcriptional repressor MraZ [bacterium]|nr:division/cell wall cluster transcriptional repressor MraZ [bacterium]